MTLELIFILLLKRKSGDSKNLPDPDIIAAEIVENPESAPIKFSIIYQELEENK